MKRFSQSGFTLQVLHNRDASIEEDGVGWSGPVPSVIDVVRIDADQGGSGVPQVFGGFPRQEWMILEVLTGLPVMVPTSVDQHRFLG